MKERLLPVKVIEAKKIDNAEALFLNKGFYTFHDGDGNNWNKYTKMDGLGSSLVLDFGKEMSGYLRIFTGWVHTANCKVRIRFGESLGEVNSEIGEKNSTNDHAIRDFFSSLPASGEAVFGPTGFRYVRIDILEEKYVFFRNIFCINEIYSAKQIYDYKGEDKRIKEIFDTAKRTIDLCAGMGYIVDGVKRDRLIWVGDLEPEIMALTTLYNDFEVIKNTLDIAREQFPLPRYMNDMYTYSFWYIIIMNDLLERFNCDSYIKENLDYLTKLVSNMKELISEKGEINKEKAYLVDWPTAKTKDEEVGVRCIFMMAMNAAEKLFKKFNVTLNDVNELKKRLLVKPYDVKEKKQVIALKYFAFGKISDKEYEMLIKDGVKGFSTFMSYYLLTAIASKDKKLAIEMMKDYYGAMLDKGATTFWEDFNIDWIKDAGRIDEINPNKKDLHGDNGAFCYIGYRHSLCHGWSSGVIKFIKENC